MVKDPARKQPPTPGNLRTALLESGLQWSVDGELLHPQDRTSLIIELDGLIEAYGEGALAEGFVRLE